MTRNPAKDQRVLREAILVLQRVYGETAVACLRSRSAGPGMTSDSAGTCQESAGRIVTNYAAELVFVGMGPPLRFMAGELGFDGERAKRAKRATLLMSNPLRVYIHMYLHIHMCVHVFYTDNFRHIIRRAEGSEQVPSERAAKAAGRLRISAHKDPEPGS